MTTIHYLLVIGIKIYSSFRIQMGVMELKFLDINSDLVPPFFLMVCFTREVGGVKEERKRFFLE